MTPNGNDPMSKSCLVILHKDPLKPSSMASPRAKVALNGQENGRRPRGMSQMSPRTGMRGYLSPAQRSRVATDTTTVSEGNEAKTVETNQEQGSPCSPHYFSAPAVETSVKMEDESPGGSASASCTALGPTVPQHEISDSSPAESQDEAIQQRNKGILLQGLLLTSACGSLTLINLSRRRLRANDARLIKRAMQENPHLSVIKLAYNCLGDEGAAIIASGFVAGGGGHHKNLSVLDLGFNGIGDVGCVALALHAVAGNRSLSVLYLSGNNIGERGALSLAGAMLHGCSLTALHISVNHLGAVGIQALARAVAENEACRNTHSGCGIGNVSPVNCGQKSMEELYLGDTSMTANGFIPIPSMLLTNNSLRILCLSNNGIDDQSMTLLSQALSRNKNVPLESVQLSFNKITCTGLECFMNAIWGSKTLRELKVDNNRIQDRGAQLAAVVLGAIELEVLDLGFNRITNVGIKALMKSLSETSSLQTLSISGIPLDATACKAVSYGLAYNSSLQVFRVDNCQVGYSGQRHIVAGIVSNRQASLRLLTGFDLGPIAITLQLPNNIETWSNEKLLRFVCFMWKEWNKLQGSTRRVHSQRKLRIEVSDTAKLGVEKTNEEKQIGPADPRTVVAAANRALALIGNDLDSSLNTEPHERRISETSPFVPANATMLERTLSGTIRVPPLVESNLGLIADIFGDVDCASDSKTTSDLDGALTPLMGTLLDPLRKCRNLEWLRTHFRSLDEVSQLPFNSADLWQLHQYFFSPTLPTVESARTNDTYSSEESAEKKSSGMSSRHSRASLCSSMPTDASPRATLGRTTSFQLLGEASMCTHSSLNLDNGHKRRSVQSEDEGKTESQATHKSKRARNFKPRIACYPRIREKLEALDTKSSHEQTLALFRLLKFVESVMFQDKDPFADNASVQDPMHPSPADVEMIILDLR